MKRSLIPLLLFFFALPSFGEFSPPGVVEARVVHGEPDAPVPGATITLRAAEGAMRTQARIEISDPEGAVRFTGVAAREYVLEVALVGFVPTTLGPFPVHENTTEMPRIKRMTVLLNEVAWICGPEIGSPAAP